MTWPRRARCTETLLHRATGHRGRGRQDGRVIGWCKSRDRMVTAPSSPCSRIKRLHEPCSVRLRPFWCPLVNSHREQLSHERVYGGPHGPVAEIIEAKLSQCDLPHDRRCVVVSRRRARNAQSTEGEAEDRWSPPPSSTDVSTSGVGAEEVCRFCCKSRPAPSFTFGVLQRIEF